jgi:hypothetical protein
MPDNAENRYCGYDGQHMQRKEVTEATQSTATAVKCKCRYCGKRTSHQPRLLRRSFCTSWRSSTEDDSGDHQLKMIQEFIS